MTLQRTPDQLAAELADITVGQRYRLLGIADHAIQEAGIMLSDEDTALGVVASEQYDQEPIVTAREQIMQALGHMATPEV